MSAKSDYMKKMKQGFYRFRGYHKIEFDPIMYATETLFYWLGQISKSGKPILIDLRGRFSPSINSITTWAQLTKAKPEAIEWFYKNKRNIIKRAFNKSK